MTQSEYENMKKKKADRDRMHMDQRDSLLVLPL